MCNVQYENIRNIQQKMLISYILILELGCPATFSARIDPYGDDIIGGEEEKYQLFSQQDSR